MKNLKKVLALVLVVATLMGFATVASAAKFSDASSIKNTEAVDVMTLIGVIDGYTDGTFRPTANVTRAQMAKMVAYIIASGEDVGSLYAGANSFTDCTSHWAKGYIAYASKTGFVAGIGGGKFNPNGSVTGVQAAKMLLCALGYDATIEGYTGSNWSVNVLDDARGAGLLKNLSGVDMSKALTREQAAQMMFNALKATMVKYSSKGSNITINGVTIAQGASDADYIKLENEGTENYAGNAAGAAGLNTQQLCEKYFSALKLLASDNKDNFGRPAKKWQFTKDKKVNTVTASSEPTYTFNGGKYADILKTLKNDGYTYDATSKDSKATLIYTNGAETHYLADYASDEYAPGVQIEVYTDGTAVDRIVMVYTYLAKVTAITKDDPKTVADERELLVTYTHDVGTKTGLKINKDTAGIDSIFDSAVKNETYVFVTPNVDTSSATTALTVAAATKVEGTISSYSANGAKFTMGGKTYEVAHNAKQAKNSTILADVANNINKEVIAYTDANGAVYMIEGKAAAAGNYAMIVGMTKKIDTTLDGKSPVVTVRAVLSDGTVGAYTLDLHKVTATEDTNNTYGAAVAGDYVISKLGTKIYAAGADVFYTADQAPAMAIAALTTSGNAYAYTISGDKITLSNDAKVTVKKATAAIANGQTSVATTDGTNATTVLMNSKTLFVMYNSDKTTATAVTGNKALGNTTMAAANQNAVIYDADGVAKVVFSSTAFADGTTEVKDYVYLDATNEEVTVNSENKTTYSYTTITADGSKLVLTASEQKTTGIYTYNEDKTVGNKAEVKTSYGAYQFLQSGTKANNKLAAGDTLVSMDNGSNYLNITKDTKVAIVADGASLESGADMIIIRTMKDGAPTMDVATIFVVAGK